jgi:outer membrane lipoprotein carrier protein
LATCKRTDSGKCWRRRLRSLISHSLLLVIFAGHPAAAQSERAAAPSGFTALEAFLDGVQSLTADFKQEVWSAEQELLRSDRGSLELKRPNRFRWTYLEPTKLIVVADGSRLSIYDVDLKQVTVAPFDESVGASPATLLSGDRNVREQFEVVATYQAEGLDWVKLEPLASSDFTSVLIGFKGAAPQRLELVDGLNEVTRVELDNLEINPQLGDEVFELDLPADVDVIGGD